LFENFIFILQKFAVTGDAFDMVSVPTGMSRAASAQGF